MKTGTSLGPVGGSWAGRRDMSKGCKMRGASAKAKRRKDSAHGETRLLWRVLRARIEIWTGCGSPYRSLRKKVAQGQ